NTHRPVEHGILGVEVEVRELRLGHRASLGEAREIAKGGFGMAKKKAGATLPGHVRKRRKHPLRAPRRP
ncbi:MAG: hypothetical protein ACKOKC_02935, partial [Chthoniobacterales bacterium]